jgi:hypothetical protein
MFASEHFSGRGGTEIAYNLTVRITVARIVFLLGYQAGFKANRTLN